MNSRPALAGTQLYAFIKSVQLNVTFVVVIVAGAVDDVIWYIPYFVIIVPFGDVFDIFVYIQNYYIYSDYFMQFGRRSHWLVYVELDEDEEKNSKIIERVNEK